ncbi:Putative Coiled-coil domain-containing protein [Septoria linicola]|uniref:Coiled-coil domain-containing protein n=1 Tax=Septoria linicola TaxID=215465 RepID=A0A9Q9B0T2_9PEZI|nr:putative Coiled-coil domain-containing protein [Septoria linicola]USW55377.1 Putative Coiled-coil domain-containing protein [Septoria linicola]
MESHKDGHLYNQDKRRNLSKGKSINSSSTLSFTSQLSSLINTSSTAPKAFSGKSKSKKEDIFATHNKNTAKRAKRDLEPDASSTFEQKHTTNGEALDKGMWERSKRKMEEKARLYAAMKRGDVEDADERYAVDFDAKWAAGRANGKESDSDDDGADDDDEEEVEYIDEFGRTRKGTKLDALRVKQQQQRREEGPGILPAAPDRVIRGDTTQHQAFDLDEPRAAQMAELAGKRDKSLTPPPDEHFDGNKEIRTKGTGFFQFSGDADERKRQMENLENERAETERRRKERDGKLAERRAQIAARREQVQQKNAKRKADEFLEELSGQMPSAATTGPSDDTPASRATEPREQEEQLPGNIHIGTTQESAPAMIDRIEEAIKRDEEEV